MSTIAATGRLMTSGIRLPRLTSDLSLRMTTFAGLAAFSALEYSALVSGAPVARVLGVVAIAAAVATALSASARLRLPRAAGTALRLALSVFALFAAVAVIGVPVRLLEPSHWSALSENVAQGLGGLTSFVWPYAGDDPWIRLAILLAVPLAVVPAGVLAFWPGAAAGPRRATALVLLLALYGLGAVEQAPSTWVGRGLILLMLVAAWLLLPRLRAHDAAPALMSLGAIAALAVALTVAVHSGGAWVDFRSWNWFSGAGGGTQFQWDQIYGPINWPRNGTELVDISSPAPHYWKAETLDRFDGLRWLHTNAGDSLPSDEVPTFFDHRWVQDMTFTVKALRSDLVVGAGTILNVASTKATVSSNDGTMRVLDAPLARGDTYTVSSYVPDPTPQELRRAPQAFPAQMLPYTYWDLPASGQSGLNAPDFGTAARNTYISTRTVQTPPQGNPVDPSLEQKIAASPYGSTYRLARALAAGEQTTYDVVTSIEGYLDRNYTYNEHPPQRRYPLPAFLFQDRSGYCQQFSGAMALMLRMDGIPARVAAGFAPGPYDLTAHVYRVRDLDAHSWVEVYFSGIGWVPFDPTPAAAPAAVGTSTSVATPAPGGSAPSPGAFPRRREAPSRSPRSLAPLASATGRGNPAAVAAIVAGAVAAAFAAAWLVAVAAARRRRHGPDGALAELRHVLHAVGFRYPQRITLLELERSLQLRAGPASARYARSLREARYADRAPGPARLPRRAIRKELVAGGGIRTRLRLLWALPPEGGRV